MARKPNIPQQAAPQIDPQDKQFVEQVTLVTQAVLADEQHSENIVQMASSGPDGMAQAVMVILSIVADRQPLSAEDAPIAAFTILMVLIDFLGKIQRYEVNDQTMRQSVAAVMDQLAQQYGATDADLADLDQMFPGISQDIMARRGQQQGMVPKQQGMMPGVAPQPQPGLAPPQQGV